MYRSRAELTKAREDPARLETNYRNIFHDTLIVNRRKREGREDGEETGMTKGFVFFFPKALLTSVFIKKRARERESQSLDEVAAKGFRSPGGLLP